MTDWVRLWHDMPTDPKWRVVARKSGQPLACVIAVFNLLMVSASQNADARGTLQGWDSEDAAAALDMEPADVAAIVSAMQGKVLDGERLTGWDKRQPKREDGTAGERKAAWKAREDAKKNASERDGTHRNAPETETETETEKKKKGGYAFSGSVVRLTKADFDRWQRAFPDLDLGAHLQMRDDWLVGQAESARAKWFNSTSSWLANRQQEAVSRKREEAKVAYPIA